MNKFNPIPYDPVILRGLVISKLLWILDSASLEIPRNLQQIASWLTEYFLTQNIECDLDSVRTAFVKWLERGE